VLFNMYDVSGFAADMYFLRYNLWVSRTQLIWKKSWPAGVRARVADNLQLLSARLKELVPKHRAI